MPDDAPLKSESAPQSDSTPKADPAIAEARTAKAGEKPARTAPAETAASSKRKKSNLRRLIALVLLAIAVIGLLRLRHARKKALHARQMAHQAGATQ